MEAAATKMLAPPQQSSAAMPSAQAAVGFQQAEAALGLLQAVRKRDKRLALRVLAAAPPLAGARGLAQPLIEGLHAFAGDDQLGEDNVIVKVRSPPPGRPDPRAPAVRVA